MRFLLIFLSIIFSLVNGLSQTLISPTVLTTLNEDIKETSGLINVNGDIWTHNDSGGADRLYQINTETGDVIRDVKIDDADNDDWEDLASDDTYIYIGDFGNNDGDRTNLKIYRISREELSDNDEVEAEKIEFSYSDQTSWEVNHNNHNFDCEAMICFQGNLYLFSKNWVDHQTRLYILPNQPGVHTAQYVATFDINCLVSGAEFLSSSNSLVIIGYNSNGGTFTWLFNNFENDNFFEGESTMLIWSMLTQAEGVCVDENNSVCISSEEFENIVDPMLYHFDFEDFITGEKEIAETDNILLFKHQENIIIKSNTGDQINGELIIYNQMGAIINQFHLQNNSTITLPVNLTSGIYFVVFTSDTIGVITKKIRL